MDHKDYSNYRYMDDYDYDEDVMGSNYYPNMPYPAGVMPGMNAPYPTGTMPAMDNMYYPTGTMPAMDNMPYPTGTMPAMDNMPYPTGTMPAMDNMPYPTGTMPAMDNMPMYPMQGMMPCPMPYPTGVMPAYDKPSYNNCHCVDERALAKKEACYRKYMCKYKVLAEKAEACKERAQRCFD